LRPPRPDIAVPPFAPGIQWIGDEPPAVERLTARGPVLVHFVDVGHLSSVRTLPYLRGWHERYAVAGLSVLAVNSPRFPFTGDPGKLAAAVERLALPFPVACDPEHHVWRAYGCEGWPSSFVWGRGGTLRWFQFGEGEYAATEEEIRALLAQEEPAGLPEPIEPLRPSDARGAGLVPPTPEHFPGGDPSRPSSAPTLELPYEAAGAAVTVDGTGELAFSIDGGPEAIVAVTAPGVYELSEHERHGKHRLRLRPSPGLDLYCVAFAPGLP
jgi:hypothetical protein